MKELIPITEHNGQKAVSARELHSFLESKQDFSTWIKNRIKKYDLVEGQDYEVFHNFMENPNGGRPMNEYALTIDCAKELSMVEGNAKGKQARQYFIECEKIAKQAVQPIKELSTLDLLELTIKGMRENQLELEEVKRDVLELKAQTQARPEYYTIAGYGSLHNVPVNIKQASSLGRKASSMCKKLGYETDTIPDPRFGKVKMYPRIVLDKVFSQPIN